MSIDLINGTNNEMRTKFDGEPLQYFCWRGENNRQGYTKGDLFTKSQAVSKRRQGPMESTSHLKTDKASHA